MLKEDKKEKYPYHSYATARYVINYAEFSVWVDSSFVDVCVVSDRGFEYPNIEKYISDRIVDYDRIEVCDEDEWNLNGFRDEADYLNYKYG